MDEESCKLPVSEGEEERIACDGWSVSGCQVDAGVGRDRVIEYLALARRGKDFLSVVGEGSGEVLDSAWYSKSEIPCIWQRQYSSGR